MSSSPPTVAPAAPPAPAATPWRPWSAAAAFVTAVGGTLLFLVLVEIAAVATGADVKSLPSWAAITSNFGEEAVLVACALGFARLHGRVQRAPMGLRAPEILPAVGLMALAGLAVYGFDALWPHLVHLSHQEDLTKKLGVDDGTGALVAIGVLVCVAAPIAEETFFRGFFFGALRNWRGVWPAAIITGLVFGAVHAGSYSAAYLPPLAFLGFALCLVRWRTDSLYPCIALHAMNNGLAFAVLRHWIWWQVALTMLAALLAVGAVVLGAVAISQRSRASSNTMTA